MTFAVFALVIVADTAAAAAAAAAAASYTTKTISLMIKAPLMSASTRARQHVHCFASAIIVFLFRNQANKTFLSL